MIETITNKLSNRLVLGILLGGLLLFTYAVLHPFIIPAAWAIIIAYATWPLLLRLRRWLGGRRGLAALAMTLLLAVAVILPTVWLVILLHHESATLYHAIDTLLEKRPFELPPLIRDIPLIGNWAQDTLNQMTSNPKALRGEIVRWLEQSADHILRLLGGAGRNAAKLGFALITIFFVYRDGERLLEQVQRVLHRFLGERVDPYLSAVGSMTKAVVWGLVLTALGQGFVAGLGYWWFGASAPVFLGAVTALVSMIPFGAPLCWGSISIWMLINGELFNGIGLFLWGAIVVSWVDNLIRPLVISSATRIPFLLVMFGVLGGLAAFGLIGLFIGPVILAVVMAVWREWLGTSVPPADAPIPLYDPPEPPSENTADA